MNGIDTMPGEAGPMTERKSLSPDALAMLIELLHNPKNLIPVGSIAVWQELQAFAQGLRGEPPKP